MRKSERQACAGVSKESPGDGEGNATACLSAGARMGRGLGEAPQKDNLLHVASEV